MQEVRYALSTLERILAENGQDGAKKAAGGGWGLGIWATFVTIRLLRVAKHIRLQAIFSFYWFYLIFPVAHDRYSGNQPGTVAVDSHGFFCCKFYPS